MARTTTPPKRSQPELRPESGFDLEHIAAVCEESIRALDTGAEPARAHATPSAAYVALPARPHQLTAMTALRHVGYHAEPMTSGQPPITPWIRVTGWDHDALARRLDALTVTAHQLTRDLPDNIAHAIDTYATIADLPDIDAPQHLAAGRLRARLREQATTATGPHAPYNPDRLPADPELAQLLTRVRTHEHRVEDLISRTWLTSLEAVAAYAGRRKEHPHHLARAQALAHTLNHGIGQTKRDTIITVLEWAREAGHGDAIAYAHWYAHTYGTTTNGPDPATAYEPWRDHATAQHPAAIAAHDHPNGRPASAPGSAPGDIHVTENTIDAADYQAQNQTHVRNTPQSGRRAS